MRPESGGERRKLAAGRMHDLPVRQQRETFDVQSDEAGVRTLPKRVGRDDGEPHAARDGLEDRLVAAELEAHVEGAATLAEEVIGGQPGARPALAGEETEAGELLRLDRIASRQRVVARRDDHEGFGMKAVHVSARSVGGRDMM